MKLDLYIRKLQKSDISDCIELFRNTVHLINCQDYTPSQVNAWAPPDINPDKWWESLSKNISYVAEYHGQIVGFGDISLQGYFDRLFIHKDFQRKGIASSLIEHLVNEAKNSGIKRIFMEVSITAKPLAEAFGCRVVKQQIKEFNGEQFVNFIMEKNLD